MGNKAFSVDDKIPSLYESYDFAGNSVSVSDIVNTDKGPAVYLVYEDFDDSGWRTVDWDSSDANRPLHGVTKWCEIEPLN